MKRFGLTPLLVLAAISTALLVAARTSPYFPGDLELGRWIQNVAPAGEWARAVTRAAYVPWVYGVLAVSALAALRIAGWRAAAAMIVTFFALMHAEHYIKDHVGRPRPSAELLKGGTVTPVATMSMSGSAALQGPRSAPSYGMPSGWALLFGATAGLVGALALRTSRGASRWVYVAGCAFVLAAGLAARVTLGQHWPSDVIAGYLIAITLGLGVYEALVAGPKPRATSSGPSRKSAARR